MEKENQLQIIHFLLSSHTHTHRDNPVQPFFLLSFSSLAYTLFVSLTHRCWYTGLNNGLRNKDMGSLEESY